MRGYIYEEKGRMKFHCHNCTETMYMKRFLERIDPVLYFEYVKETMDDKRQTENKELYAFAEKLKTPKYLAETPLKKLKKVSQLPSEHPLKKYIVGRHIPNKHHAKIFLCPNFYHWVNELVPNKFSEESLMRDETRMVIPFINKQGELHALQGRTLNDSDHHRIKYITIVVDDETPKVWGLDGCDMNWRYYTLEGPIDAMFIPNAIATAGGDLASTIRTFPKERNVIVYDNEPRKPETIKKMEKAIDFGFQVCIWPEWVTHKDINDMIKNGFTAEQVKDIIDSNIHQGLSAKITLSSWRKA